MKAILHTDASCSIREKGALAPMRIGYILKTEAGTVVARVGQAVTDMYGQGKGTVNRAEYLAVIHGIRHALRLGFDFVQVVIDSQLVARQLSGAYKILDRNLQRHAREVNELGKIAQINIEWVHREQNTEADELTHLTLYDQISYPAPTPPLHFHRWQAAMILSWFIKNPDDLSDATVARIFSPQGIDGHEWMTYIRQIRNGKAYRHANMDQKPNWDKVSRGSYDAYLDDRRAFFATIGFETEETPPDAA